jgi:hypothetical protein
MVGWVSGADFLQVGSGRQNGNEFRKPCAGSLLIYRSGLEHTKDTWRLKNLRPQLPFKPSGTERRQTAKILQA